MTIQHSVPATRSHATARRSALRSLAVPAVSTAVYFVVRPFVDSDAGALAVAGAVPAAYTIAIAVLARRVALMAVLSSIAFALGCLISLLADGSSLPLKLNEAAVTFVLGLLLLGAVLVGRPLAIGRTLKVPHADPRLDANLSVVVGAFLVLHALLHVMLAVTLSTATFVTVGRAMSWGTIGVGAVGLYAYLRRVRRRAAVAADERSRPESGLRRP
jgi:intracellular septation protein A